MCVLAAMIGITYRGMDRNILVEIGLVVLVGLAAKNAILIVEFAKQGEEQGKARFEAEFGLKSVAPQRGWEALKAIGWSIQTPRPKNPKSASPEEAAAFKKARGCRCRGGR
jgi:AcrB/AcrD/AcrF family/Winged helix-turn helix